MNNAVNKESMLNKSYVLIYTWTCNSAAFMNVCAAHEQAVETDNSLAPILTARKDLLHASSILSPRLNEVYSKLHENLILARRDMYLSQSPFPERSKGCFCSEPV